MKEIESHPERCCTMGTVRQENGMKDIRQGQNIIGIMRNNFPMNSQFQVEKLIVLFKLAFILSTFIGI